MILKVIVVCAVVAAVGYGIYAAVNGTWPFSMGEGGGTIPVTIPQLQDDPPVVVAEIPQTLYIRIYEERILYDDAEISMAELEEVLLRYRDNDDTWLLQDAFRASNTVYNDVRELLIRLNISFAEMNS